MNKKQQIRIEKLAKILWQVHSFCYQPFYSNNPKPLSWNSLKEVEKDKSLVDKTFFRKMAQDVLLKIDKDVKDK